MAEDKKIKQYQEKISILGEAQEEVFRQFGNSVKWAGPLKQWKFAMRGALIEASSEEDDLVREFEGEWNDILDKYGIKKLRDKDSIDEEPYEELVQKIQDWQQRLGMGFTEAKEEKIQIDLTVVGDDKGKSEMGLSGK